MRYLLIGLLCLVGCSVKVRTGTVLLKEEPISYRIIVETSTGNRSLQVVPEQFHQLKPGDMVRYDDYEYLGKVTSEAQ